MPDIYFLVQRSTAGSVTLPFIQIVGYCFDDQPTLHVRQEGYLYQICKFAPEPPRRDVRILSRVPQTTSGDVLNVICADETYEAVSAKLESVVSEEISRWRDAGLLPNQINHIREENRTPTTVLTAWVSNWKAGTRMRWDLRYCAVDDAWFGEGV